ncbi:Release factor glutamine methyltransferase [Phytophthora ramorum]|uniref:Release factor glutamine methyltransferase n=1 Tax=Phytophthora ramorum TaxID=164328 RepID=UPI00309FF351|nr:Release factor glutamine methyltransferase [Phytophthora ramorum]
MHRCRSLISAVPQRRVRSLQTVADAVQATREILNGSCALKSALNDAKALVANALQPALETSNDLFFHSERKLTSQEATALQLSVERRLKGEPLAYVLGRREFWSLDFAVTQDTLIPRSDSEVLIETLVEQFNRETPLRILDIGTGSGCLLLSALSEFPQATGVGVDISPGALAVAERNARSNQLGGRTEFRLRDLQTLTGVREEDEFYQRFDVILCNPPYIPTRELDLVGADVLEYEPHLALFSDGGPTSDLTGTDPQGLRMYRLLGESVANLFKSDNVVKAGARQASESNGELSAVKRCLLVEIGSEGQARAVKGLFSNTAATGSLRDEASNGSSLRFERFLFDAGGKYRGLLFVAP